MKKYLVFLLCVLLCVMVACGDGNVTSDGSQSVESTQSVDTLSSDIVSSDIVSSDIVSSDIVSSDTKSESDTSSKEEQKVDDWRTHPEDYKLIALTYDDAPSFSNTTGNATVKIIDAINKYEGRGTLFVVGSTLSRNGDKLLRYAVEKGFELGNHTYSHNSVSTSEVGRNWTTEENQADFSRCQELVKTQVGVDMKFLRPAGVHANDALYEAARNLGLPCVSGNSIQAVSDYKSDTTAEMIVERVLNNAFDGAIILLHGNNDRTAEATERLCEILYNDGYRFCTVSELFELKNIDYGNLPGGVMLYGIDPETGDLITKSKY